MQSRREPKDSCSDDYDLAVWSRHVDCELSWETSDLRLLLEGRRQSRYRPRAARYRITSQLSGAQGHGNAQVGQHTGSTRKIEHQVPLIARRSKCAKELVVADGLSDQTLQQTRGHIGNSNYLARTVLVLYAYLIVSSRCHTSRTGYK